jgi:uncharacterized membrane-anchored protein YhcB (DUF1043 family)
MAWLQWALPVLILGIAAVAIGFLIGRTSSDAVKRSTQLDQELRDAREELDRYRNRVVEHFSTTADLVNRMTADYRAVYEHLAQGAHQLAGSQVPRLEAIASSSGRPVVEPPAGGIAEGLHEAEDGTPEDEPRRKGANGNGGTPEHREEGRKSEGWYDDVAPGTEVPDYARDERYR